MQTLCSPLKKIQSYGRFTFNRGTGKSIAWHSFFVAGMSNLLISSVCLIHFSFADQYAVSRVSG